MHFRVFSEGQGIVRMEDIFGLLKLQKIILGA